MAEVLSLKDLKKENKSEGQEKPKVDDEYVEEGEELEANAEEQAEEQADEPEQEAAEEGREGDEADEDEESSEGEEGEEEAPAEAWMQSEDESESEEASTGIDPSEAAKIRRKYKGKLSEARDELEALRQENEQLKQGSPRQGQPQVPPRPQRNQFKTDEEFVEKLADWRYEVREAERNTSKIAEENQRVQAEDRQYTEQQVESHYERAARLAGKAGISPEKYQAADRRVRAAVEERFPEMGDDIIDELISVTGEGSERVFYHLGVNSKKLDEFVDTLGKKRGLATSAYLARLAERLNAPTKRQSGAPAPATSVRSDKQNSAGGDKLRRQYREAHKGRDTQKAWDIKKKARASGVDVSGW
jgi:hypothetical protein